MSVAGEYIHDTCARKHLGMPELTFEMYMLYTCIHLATDFSKAYFEQKSQVNDIN